MYPEPASAIDIVTPSASATKLPLASRTKLTSKPDPPPALVVATAT